MEPMVVNFTISANGKSVECILDRNKRDEWLATTKSDSGITELWDASREEAIIFAVVAALGDCGTDLTDEAGKQRAREWMDTMLNTVPIHRLTRSMYRVTDRSDLPNDP